MQKIYSIFCAGRSFLETRTEEDSNRAMFIITRSAMMIIELITVPPTLVKKAANFSYPNFQKAVAILASRDKCMFAHNELNAEKEKDIGEEEEANETKELIDHLFRDDKIFYYDAEHKGFAGFLTIFQTIGIKVNLKYDSMTRFVRDVIVLVHQIAHLKKVLHASSGYYDIKLTSLKAKEEASDCVDHNVCQGKPVVKNKDHAVLFAKAYGFASCLPDYNPPQKIDASESGFDKERLFAEMKKKAGIKKDHKSVEVSL